LATGSRVTQVAPDIYLIDCFFAGLPGQCGVFLVRGESPALVDTGPSVNAPDIVAGLAHLGLSAADVRYILLTHFHLDHAGAVSYLLERNAEASVLVDPGSISFLTEPERLVRSAQRSLGEVARHYGTMLPVASERITPLQDGCELDLGGGKYLRAMHTPGHSRGHFAFYEPGSGALLCGDALGHFMQEASYIFPATPAPEFDLAASLDSAARLAKLSPEVLLFPHFGFSRDVHAVIQQFMDQVKRFVQMAAGLEEGKRDPQHLAELLFRDLPGLGDDEAELQRGILTVNAAGILHYLSRSARKGL